MGLHVASGCMPYVCYMAMPYSYAILLCHMAMPSIWEFLFCWGPTPTPLNRFYSPHIRQGQAVFYP